jgi:chromosome segregation ATPase
MIDLRQKIAEIEQKVEALNTERQSIETDQKRYRENIESLSKTPEAKTLIERYIAKANEQETRLEEIEKQRRAFEQQRTDLENQLADKIKNFSMKDQAMS